MNNTDPLRGRRRSPIRRAILPRLAGISAAHATALHTTPRAIAAINAASPDTAYVLRTSTDY